MPPARAWLLVDPRAALALTLCTTRYGAQTPPQRATELLTRRQGFAEPIAESGVGSRGIP